MNAPSTAVRSALILALGLVAGCGGKSSGVTLTGQLVSNGTPFVAPENTSINLTFMPADKSSTAYGCTAQPDPKTGQFDVVGPASGLGILPGAYKIAVSAPSGANYKDLFKDAFSVERTPLSYTVTSAGSQSINIDLQKRTVTAK